MSGPDAQRALAKYRRLAGGYDRRIRLTAPYRRAAVELLRLSPGETVLDVACGTGINFRMIEDRIGPDGRLLGLDLSPEMLEEARRRVERAGWRNVSLIEAGIEAASLPEPPDALLFSLTHDVMQMPAGLQNLIRQANPGARIAVFGPKFAARAGSFVNPIVKAVARAYVTTYDGLERPWTHLEPLVDDLRVHPVALGGAYLAEARTKG